MFWQKMWEIVHWVVVCSRQSCFVRWIIKWGYGQVWEMESAAEGMGLRVNANGKKSSGSKVDPCGVCGEWVDCNSIKCTKCQRWAHHCCSDVPRQVSLLSCWDVLICRTCLAHSCTVEERLEFKRGEAVLEKVELCYLGDMISWWYD